MRDIVIFGTGGFAREVHELIEDLQQVDPSSWNVVGFLDGNSQKHGTIVHDLPVLGGAE
ncbi:MAG: transferase, partial [Mycobacterium leprae]